VAHVEGPQAPETADGFGDAPVERVGGQVEHPQEGEVSDGRRERAGQVAGRQAQRHHAARPAAAAAAHHAVPPTGYRSRRCCSTRRGRLGSAPP
jgi:hypothetical protein